MISVCVCVCSYSQVIPEQLHDECGVFVRVLLQLIQFSNCIIKSLQCIIYQSLNVAIVTKILSYQHFKFTNMAFGLDKIVLFMEQRCPVLIERFKCDLCDRYMEQRCPDREV